MMKRLALACIVPVLLSAQIAHVQSAGKVGSKISFTPKTQGDLLIVLSGCSNLSALTISDSAANSWKVLNPSAAQAGEGEAQSWYAFSKGTASITVTVAGC